MNKVDSKPSQRPGFQDEEARLTEDEMARRDLGGTKGSPSLPDAPMTEQRRKKTFPNDENDGHVA